MKAFHASKLLIYLISLLIGMTVISTPASAALNIPFTVTMSEPVNITGTPRIVLNVDGNTRYANFSSGTGTSSLTFTYSPTVGDVDLDGIGISSTSIDLNGGTVKDLRGNDLSPATFTAPNTSGVNINYPSLSLDFVYDADGRYSVNGVVYNDLPSFMTAVGGTYGRGGSATYYDNTGTIRSAAANTPRFDYDPNTLQAKGLQMEGYILNIAKYSADINLSPWVVSNGTITANSTTAPDGTNTAEKLVENASTGDKEFSQSLTVTNATVYTASIYAKAAERTQVRFRSSGGSSIFTLTGSGTAVSGGTDTASIQKINNGWYRLSVKFTSSSTSDTLFFALINGGVSSYTGDGISGVYAWGAQVENAYSASSYIATASGSGARQADTFSIPTGSWFSATEGTMASKSIVSAYNGVVNCTYALNSGTTNFMQFCFSGASLTYDVNNSSVSQASLSVGSTQNDFETVVTSYKANSFKIVKEGGSIGSDTSGTIPSITGIRIGTNLYGVAHIRGGISYFKYYPVQPSNTQLQLLSQ